MMPSLSGQTPTAPPSVSVIIPARSAQRTVAKAVVSALRQEDPSPIEVVVAAADKATADAAMDVGDRRVKVVDNPEGSTPVGLNLALAATSGDVIVRCDAHAELPPGYISRAVAGLSEPRVVNIGGRQLAKGETPFERAVALAMNSPVGAGDARYRIGGRSGPVDTVYLGAFRRSALEAIGGFDETLDRNQDYELNWRLRQAGGVVWFDNELEVKYRPRGNVKSLASQYFQYGRWKRLVIRRHPESLRWRQLAAPLLVGGLGGSAAIGVFSSRLGAVLPVAYLIVSFGVSLVDLVRTRDPAALIEAPVLWTMHLAWGTGFILGPPSGTR